METPHLPLQQFVRAVHRRHVALRVLERAAVGLLCASGVGVVLVGVLAWRGEDAWGVAGVVLVLGAVAGAAWGLTARPTALAAAAEADRQLGTADLLATAWAVRGRAATDETTDPFRAAVLALAAARCRSLSPSAVLLRRLGMRAWGGVVLAVAFVATLAALADRSPRADAAAHVDAGRPRNAVREIDRRPIVQITPDHGSGGPQRVERRPGEAGAPDRESPVAGPDESAADATDAQPVRDDRALSGASPGTGAGEARSQATASSPQSPPATPGIETPQGRRNGAPSAGAGQAAESPSLTQISGGGTVTPRGSQDEVPWSRPDWGTAVSDALRALQDGRVADDYRDLVRVYFDPAAGASADSGTPEK